MSTSTRPIPRVFFQIYLLKVETFIAIAEIAGILACTKRSVMALFFSLFLFLALSTNSSAITHVEDPAALKRIEDSGFSFAELVFEQNKPSTNAELARLSTYQSWHEVIANDLDKRAAEDPYLAVTMAKKHRLFNKAWLTSPKARFELVGIFNRADRDVFARSEDGRCGEIRFIYRLAYSFENQGKTVYSRLPMTVNVVFHAGGKHLPTEEDCRRVHSSWVEASTLKLEKTTFKPTLLKSVEINLQSVRWPSSVRTDMGGYAEYLMRVFMRTESGKFIVAAMENMPDVGLINSNPSLKKDFQAWLKNPNNAAALMGGYGTLPEKFLAKKAISVALYGSGRAANLPFSQLLTLEDLSSIKYVDQPYVKSAASYLRRLNDMSCVGCHQGRAVAGFHFVGIDSEKTHNANRILMASSAHLISDLRRRESYLAATSKGVKRDPSRALSERPHDETGGYGAHCGLSQDPIFKTWTCNSEHRCEPVDTNTRDVDVGRCMPIKGVTAGDPCDFGRVSWNADGTKDKMTNKVSRSCGDGLWCLNAGDGFPGGMCFGECSNKQPGEACGSIAVGGFNECLGRGVLFLKCLDDHTSPITTKSCDQSAPCRDDYICARTESGAGACVPPYFLFQLRVDGHPKP